MEKLICFIYIVLINFVVCLAQSNKTIIPVKELSDEMDSSFVTMNFGEFNLYYTPNKPIIFPLYKITDSLKLLVFVDFHIKKQQNDYIAINSIKLKQIDTLVNLSIKDSLKIINTAVKIR